MPTPEAEFPADHRNRIRTDMSAAKHSLRERVPWLLDPGFGAPGGRGSVPWGLMVPAVLLVVLPALTALHAYRETRQAFQTQLQDGRLAHAIAVADHVAAALAGTERQVRMLAGLRAEQILPDLAVVELVSSAMGDIGEVTDAESGDRQLWLQRADGRVIAPPAAERAALADVSILTGELRSGWSFPTRPGSNAAVALYAMPLTLPDEAVATWALGSVDLGSIVDDAEYASLGTSGAISLVEADGRVRFSTDPSRRGGYLHAQDVIDILASGRDEVSAYYAPRTATRQFSAVARVSGSPLHVLLSQAEHEVQQPLNRLSLTLDRGVLAANAIGLVLMVLALHSARRRQHALIAERALQTAVLSSMSDILLVRDRTGRILFGNAAASTFLDVQPGALPGRRMAELLDTQPAAELARIDADVLRSDASRVHRWHGRRASGEPFALWTMSHPLRDRQGRTVGVLSVSRDTSQLDEASRRLQESEQHLRRITDNVPALISYIDADGRYRFNNRAFALWLERGVDELVGRTLADVHGQAAADLVATPLAQALATGNPVSFEVTLPSNGHTYACTFVPDVGGDDDVRGVYSLALDVTEQRALEASSKRESLERTWLSVAEREQERLGRELHDSVGQELAGASFLAKALAVRLEGSALAADADWVKQLLTRCVEHVRGLSRQLSPTELEHGTVLAAIDRLCADVERSYGVSCELLASQRARSLCSAITANAARQLYRVCQEALNNAMRHGASTRISVRMDLRGRMLRLAIADNGSGFASGLPNAHDPTAGGVGLKSMRLRAQSLGGLLHIGRHVGWTLIILRAPFGRLMFTATDPSSPASTTQGSEHAYPGD